MLADACFDPFCTVGKSGSGRKIPDRRISQRKSLPGSWRRRQISSWELGEEVIVSVPEFYFRGNIVKRELEFSQSGSVSAVLFWNRGGEYVACKKYGREKKAKYRIQWKCTGQQHLCQRSGGHFAVGACEYRRLPHCAPYGICARPAQGEDLMILSAQQR